MDHTTLIDRILEVERSARALSDEALERQANMDQTLAEESAAILKKYMDRAQADLERLAQSEQEKKAQKGRNLLPRDLGRVLILSPRIGS